VGSIEYETALQAVEERLSEGAAAHSVRAAETAARLAVVYGADVEQARIAAVLHDWDREQGAQRLLDAARDADIAVSEVDEQVPYLLHPRTAAAELAEALPGLPAEVLSAVRNHTVGSADMSDLDMVVYLADMIEPARDYPGVDELRDAVGTMSLHELFALGYQHSVAYLVATRRRIHPDTVAVWNALVAGGSR